MSTINTVNGNKLETFIRTSAGAVTVNSNKIFKTTVERIFIDTSVLPHREVRTEFVTELFFKTRHAAKTVADKILHDLCHEYCGSRLYAIAYDHNKYNYINLLSNDEIDLKLTDKTVKYICKHMVSLLESYYGDSLAMVNTGTYYHCDNDELINDVNSIMKTEASKLTFSLVSYSEK